MAPGEEPNAPERPVNNTNLAAISLPTIKEEEPPPVKEKEKNIVFKEQYLKLHSVQIAPEGRVQALRNKFEQSDKPDGSSSSPKDLKKEEVPKLEPKTKEESESVSNEVEEVQVKENVTKLEILSDTSNSEEESSNSQLPKDTENQQIPEPLEEEELKSPTIIHTTFVSTKSVLRKSSSSESSEDETSKPKKRVSFSFSYDEFKSLPVPKPRTSLMKTVTVSEAYISPEILIAETVIIKEDKQEAINFAEPEDRHKIVTQSPSPSIENIPKILDSFIMDNPKKVRSQSFRSKIRNIFGKDKDKKSKEKGDDNKTKTKKTDNVVFADNAQNESFNRHSTVRHTVDAITRNSNQSNYNHNQPNNYQLNETAQQLQQYQQQQQQQKQMQQQEIEQRFAAMHISNFQRTRETFVNQQEPNHLIRRLSFDQSPTQSQSPVQGCNPGEDYVCMDQKTNESKNYMNVPKYDSSSTNTIGSETSTTSVNPLQQIKHEQNVLRAKFFNEVPTTSTPQVKTVDNKPFDNSNSQRPLPNPNVYQHLQRSNLNQEVTVIVDDFTNGYGPVILRRSSVSSDVSTNSPKSPKSVEGTKLKLPANREKIDLQPRIKSPILSIVNTDKLIATELLKTNKKDKKDKDRDITSPSHQKLLEIDYPESSLTESNLEHENSQENPMQNQEAAEWQRVQRDLATSPSLKNVQVTTNALVHVDPSMSQDGHMSSRSVTPVMTTRGSNASLQRSPPKHEIRQSVEAFCWKELKKLKEKEDQQMQMLMGRPMVSSCGYAEDPIRRSRSMAVTQRLPKRSTSLPREVRRTDDLDLQQRRLAQQERFNRNNAQRNTIDNCGNGTKPIFNRGSLTHQQNAIDQPIYNKKVSFHGSENRGEQWPTRNGFTQSPPQRRLDADGAEEIEVASPIQKLPLAEDQQNGPPSRNDIFLLNQQRQKELLLAKAQRSNAPVPIDGGSLSISRCSSIQTVDSEVPPMRNLREPIYGSRPNNGNGYPPNRIMNDSPFSGRSNTSTSNEGSHYVLRNNCASTPNSNNEGIYGQRESPYGARNLNNESPYGIRSSNNESPYGTRNINKNENPYGTRPQNESPYGSRPQNESPYGSRPQNESPYGSRPQNENPYGSRPKNESPYGHRPQKNYENPYGTRSQIENPYGTKPQNESPYGSRPNVQNPYGSRPSSNESSYVSVQYGTRGQVVMQEPIYGTKQHPPMVVHENIYGSRPGPPMEPIYGSRQMRPPGLPTGNPRFPQENIYGTRNNPNGEGIYGSRQYYQNRPNIPPNRIGISRSNSLRQESSQFQDQSPESLYGGRPNFSKPPSGVQYRSPRPAEYDYPPDIPPESPPINQHHQSEPIYVRKQQTVNNKVCDMYGKIHDAGVPMSPPPNQKAGVLYGQLQRNSNVPPPIYQSYQHIQPSSNGTNFARGTRLTASVNDMNRYPSNGNVAPPNRPLPPIPDEPIKKSRFFSRKKSEAKEEEWNSDGKRGGLSGSESGGRSDTDGDIRSRSSRNNRRDDPRRHTLAGEQYGMSGQGGPLSRTMDLEGQPRGYPPPSNAMLFDDDPGIMSEVETSSTGFRRGGKQRSSLPVVRTPSKTLERPLGLVFLQYRNETKRALLPNEITSIDTVKALFVRSFPKQLTMEYLDSPQVKIYIHDSSKDMFYELEDLRSHLREIRDRSVLRLFESADVSGGLPMAGIGIAGGAGVPHFEDPSYFSEPEFDSEYQHQHIHKSKGSAKGAPYYIGSTASLPRAGLLRAYSPAVGNLPQDRMKTLPTGAPPKPQRAYSSGTARSGTDGGVGARAAAPDRFAQFVQRPNNSLYNIPDGYMSSPERGSRYEEAYYSQYGTRSGSITPVIDEEVSDTELIDDQYSIYGVKIAPPGGPRPAPRTQFSTPAAPPYDATRIRVEHMERQLANLTGLVQKALTHQTPATLQVPSTGRDSYRGDDFDYDMNMNSTSSSMQTLSDKSVSFEKSVSFSDEPPDMNSPKQHSPQHSADTKPTKPAIKSSTLPRTSSQERDRLKPAPPPKPASLSPGQYDGRHIYRDLQLTPEMYNQLRGLQKKAKDLRAEVRNLRRMSQAQAHSVRETIRDTFIKIRAMLMVGGEQVWQAGMDQERTRLSREEDLYKQEMIRLETDLGDLESTVEELRGNVINRKTRVNMSDVENMALILSKSSKTVADLKLRFPMLQDGMKSMLSTEMEKVVREEKFLKEEPERLESALRRCKKLTGTLVTLKRLASVQEQRLPCSATAADGRLSPTEPTPITSTSAQHSKPIASPRVGSLGIGGDTTNASDCHQRPENALDALLDELQTFSKPHTVNTQIPQVSYPPDSDPPSLPIKGIQPSHHHPPSMHEIGRKGSMDSATLLPTQTLTVSTATGSLRRLHSYPSGSDTDNSPPIQPLQRGQGEGKQSGKPPLPERNADLLQHISSKRVPPPPPPRTSSKSPLASPTSPSLPPRSPASNLQHIQNVQNMVENKPQSQFEAATQNLGLGTLRRNIQNRSSLKDSNKSATLPRNIGSNLQVHNPIEIDTTAISASNSSSCESVNSQDGTKKRKEELEQRHQELLKKQKALQEQYARLQQLQRGTNTLAVIPPAPDQLLKKTGSESNILQKMGLQLTTSQMTGSLTNLPMKSNANQQNNNVTTGDDTSTSSNSSNTTNKVYETDIL